MSDHAWKAFERDAAALFGATRHWANSGERLDFESATAVGQCKLVKTLSLESLSALAEELAVVAKHTNKLGVICVKCRRGRGKASPMLVVMTSEQFQDWFDMSSRG